MIEAGNTIEGMEGRCKPWWNSGDGDGGYWKLFDIPLRKLIKKAGKEAEAALLPGGNLMFTFVMRGACQEVLYDHLPQRSKDRVRFGKELVGIFEANECNDDDGAVPGLMCKFRDGTVEGPFDLVVGSDGIRSSVREYVETGAISEDPEKRRGGYYSGLRISYAVQDGKTATETGKDEPPALATVNLGNGAFCLTPTFGTGKGKPNASCVFSVYMDEDYVGPFRIPRWRRGKSNGGKPKIGAGVAVDRSPDEWRGAMMRQLREYGVPDKEPGRVIKNANRFFELGVYFHNPFAGWSRRVVSTTTTKNVAGGGVGVVSSSSYAVLIGDAAHAMPPFLGQGANQTVQDAYSLSELIKRYNAQFDGSGSTTGGVDAEEGATNDFGKMLIDHEKSRKAVVSSIVVRTLLLGYLNLGGPFGVYAKFRDVVFRTMGLFQSVVLGAAMPKV